LHHETWIRRLALIVLVLVASIAGAAPIEPGHVVVIDGDTIRVAGETFRLVGFDTPETYRARCLAERELGNRATIRLRQLVADGGLDFERVRCACRPETEGTRRCNHGRSCGVLEVRGRDVGSVLISEGLAHPFICGRTSCPPQPSWCG
jgi:endonuclease YncB( thermonuclease family)